MKEYFIKIHWTGEITLVQAKSTVNNMKRIVDGYIKIVNSEKLPSLTLVCDKEGKFKNKPVNRKACILYNDYVAGDAVIATTNSDGIKGFSLNEAFKANDEIAKVLLKEGELF